MCTFKLQLMPKVRRGKAVATKLRSCICKEAVTRGMLATYEKTIPLLTSKLERKWLATGSLHFEPYAPSNLQAYPSPVQIGISQWLSLDGWVHVLSLQEQPPWSCSAGRAHQNGPLYAQSASP